MRPSARLVRAVTAERADLERRRAHLAREAADLRAALARIEAGMADIDAQCLLLDRVVAGAPNTPASSGPAGGEATTPAPSGGDNRAAPIALADASRALRGPAIRTAAVTVLLNAGRGGLHYREWYELLVRSGHEVAGKDPLAVFLTQLGRSPVVRKGQNPGHYELDRDAPQRLKRRLDRLHREYLNATRAQRTRITAEIAHTEKQLDEATQALQDLQHAA